MSAVRDRGEGLSLRYQTALAEYLEHPEEPELVRAYELGRQALDSGDGLLGLMAIHQDALDALLERTKRWRARARAVRLAGEFFAESLGPFEMAQRSFREANLRLQTANEQLSEANEELATSNSAVERQRAVLAAVIASMSEGLIVTDSDLVVTACNGRAAELLGDDPARIVGCEIETVSERLAGIHEDPDGFRSFWGPAFQRPASRPTLEFRTRGSPQRDLLLELFPVERGSSFGLGLLLRDVSADRQLARAKDELVALVSHEIRSPLTAIVGFARLLLRGEKDATRRTQFVEHIANEGDRLTTLVNEFLDLQRLDRGAERLTLADVDLAPLLERTRELLADAAKYTVTVDVGHDLPPVRADAERIWQVLVNLVTNACKYSPEGGEIRVAARAGKNEIEISVADQGLGIPSNALPRVFEEFYRVASPEHGAIAGTGLGLSISRKIVEAHSGRIWAESDGPGKGARFSFSLPTAAR